MSRDVRIYALLARAAPRGVILRRGPSKQVLLLGWNTATDEISEGQWLKGRIYERRCDLSPDGALLLYFAASYRAPYFSWSAISKPPYLTALALWPKGDAWGGGGLFETANRIALNHRETEMVLAEGFHVPKWLEVCPLGKHSGWGEDDPIWSSRLQRDGWTLISTGKPAKEDSAGKVWIELDPPIIWEKRHPIVPELHTLQMTIRGIKEQNGPWYLTEHSVYSAAGESHSIGRSAWADWSPSGDLLFSKRSSLYRVNYQNGLLLPLHDALEIIDLQNVTFTECEAPAEARIWPNIKPPRKRRPT